MIPVTVKKLKNKRYKRLKKEFDQEVSLISRLNHPNIVKLLGVTTPGDSYCMVFEFMKLGRLDIFLGSEVKPLDEEEKTQGM